MKKIVFTTLTVLFCQVGSIVTIPMVSAYSDDTVFAVSDSRGSMRFVDLNGDKTRLDVNFDGLRNDEGTMFRDSNNALHWVSLEYDNDAVTIVDETGVAEADLDSSYDTVGVGELDSAYAGEEIVACSITPLITVSVLSYNADNNTLTTIRSFTGTPVGSGYAHNCKSIVVADTDGDGDNEIALANEFTTDDSIKIRVYNTTGLLQRTIKLNSEAFVDGFIYARDLLAVDVNHDSAGAELIYSGVVMTVADRSKTFLTIPEALQPTRYPSYAIADIRGNSKLEYIYLEDGRHAKIHIAKKNGTVIDSFQVFPDNNASGHQFDLFLIPN